MLRKWKKKELTSPATVWFKRQHAPELGRRWIGEIEKGDELTFPDGVVCKVEVTGTYCVSIDLWDDIFDELTPNIDLDD